MIGQTAERLRTDDVVDAAVDQFDHFARQKPAFACLIADADDRLRVFDETVDAHGRFEMTAFGESLCGAGAQSFNGPDTGF